MKHKQMFLISLFALLLTALLAGCGSLAGLGAAPAPTDIPLVTGDTGVIAEGNIVPVELDPPLHPHRRQSGRGAGEGRRYRR